KPPTEWLHLEWRPHHETPRRHPRLSHRARFVRVILQRAATGKGVPVGILALPPANTMQQRLGVFREALRDLGYEEGRNLIVESRFADGDYDRLPVLAGDLARLKVDVFLTPGEPVLLAAKEKGENIPIVVVTCDPLEKLLGSLRRPGGNATGFSCVC